MAYTHTGKQGIEEHLLDSFSNIRDITVDGLKAMKPAKNFTGPAFKRANSALAETMEQASRIINLIQHFRAPSKGEGEKHIPARTSIYDSVYQVMRAMQYEFPLNNVTILKILPQNLSPIPIVREHLEMIFFELFFHARQALDGRPGIISIEASEKVHDAPRDKNRRTFHLRFSFSGPETAARKPVRFFDPFSGEDCSTGMGLFVIKKVVEYNHGKVRVESSERTTNFLMEFPG